MKFKMYKTILFIFAFLLFLSSASANPTFQIEDKQKRPFVVRPAEVEDSTGLELLSDLEEDGLNIPTPTTLRAEKYRLQLAQEMSCEPTEKYWAVVDPATPTMIGIFSFDGISVLFLHPDYRNRGIGTRALMGINDYFMTRIGKQDIDIGAMDLVEKEQIVTYEAFKKSVKATSYPYAGYEAGTRPDNVGSLLLHMRTGLNPNRFDYADGEIYFDFPATPARQGLVPVLEGLTHKNPARKEEVLKWWLQYCKSFGPS